MFFYTFATFSADGAFFQDMKRRLMFNFYQTIMKIDYFQDLKSALIPQHFDLN